MQLIRFFDKLLLFQIGKVLKTKNVELSGIVQFFVDKWSLTQSMIGRTSEHSLLIVKNKFYVVAEVPFKYFTTLSKSFMIFYHLVFINL